jgi:hypothetical protein
MSALVWPVLVVVANVFAQRGEQMLFAVDEDVVQALAAGGADPPFSECVRPRRSSRCPHDPYVLVGEHRVKRAGELRVPIADEKLEALGRSLG